MFYHTLNPVLLHLGPVEIRYYGLVYALGFIIAYFLIKHLATQRKVHFAKEHVDTYIFYMIIGVIAGARLIYVLFYNPTYYLMHPFQIFALWKGGLSFHGGVLGGALMAFLFSRRYQYRFLALADLTAIPLALALFFGRIANFINGELYGRITTLSWGVKFSNVDGFRHPSQLYEAAKNLFLFGVLWHYRKTTWKDGTLFALFLIGYSVLRFFIEFVREPELYVSILTMGQFLSLFTLLFGVIILWKK